MIQLILCLILACLAASSAQAADPSGTTRAIEYSKLKTLINTMDNSTQAHFDRIAEKIVESLDGVSNKLDPILRNQSDSYCLVKQLNVGTSGIDVDDFRSSQLDPCMKFLAKAGNLALAILNDFKRDESSKLEKELLGFTYCDWIVDRIDKITVRMHRCTLFSYTDCRRCAMSLALG